MFDNIQVALLAVNQLCNQEALRGDQAAIRAGRFTDAHTHTQNQIKNGYPILIMADNQFIGSARTPQAYQEIERQIRQYAELAVANHLYSSRDLANLNRILNLIKSFVNGPTSGIENIETMVSIPDLLLRCWTLAKKKSIDTLHADKSRLTQILMCLDGNIADGGKCMPGVVARLYPAYARFLKEELILELSKQAYRARFRT